MLISVLITTFNRPELLKRAVNSVLAQDHKDLELVVIDDVSDQPASEALAEIIDPRLKIIRNKINVGSVDGDIAILRSFLAEHCRGDAFLYLCDDDYLIPTNLLSRQAQALEGDPTLSFVQGGMMQLFPAPIGLMIPNVKYIHYEFSDGRRQLFGRGLFPITPMSGKEYLTLFAVDPKNRNIITGATLFRLSMFKASGAFDRLTGVRWQGGYAMMAGAATQGGVLYLDEPCIMTMVDSGSASYRGGQSTHLLDALSSIDAAFGGDFGRNIMEGYRAVRNVMAHSVLMIYLSNKIGYRLGWFKKNALGDISSFFEPLILSQQFLDIAKNFGIPLSADNERAIWLSDDEFIESRQWPEILRLIKAPT